MISLDIRILDEAKREMFQARPSEVYNIIKSLTKSVRIKWTPGFHQLFWNISIFQNCHGKKLSLHITWKHISVCQSLFRLHKFSLANAKIFAQFVTHYGLWLWEINIGLYALAFIRVGADTCIRTGGRHFRALKLNIRPHHDKNKFWTTFVFQNALYIYFRSSLNTNIYI